MDDDDMVRRPFGGCVTPKLSEEILALLRKDLPKYGPVMKFATTKRYKFKRTLKCSPAEMERIEEAKRQEAATGIKRQTIIGYYSPDPTFVADPDCPGLCPVDIRKLAPSADIPPPSFQRYLDTYQERRAALEARAAAAAARPPRPRIFIDPQMKKKLLTLHTKHEATAGAKAQAECLGSGLKRPCDDDDSGTSEEEETTDADFEFFVAADHSSLEIVTEGQAECRGSGVKRPRDDLNPVAADDSSATVTEGQSEREGSVLKRPRNDTNHGATDLVSNSK